MNTQLAEIGTLTFTQFNSGSGQISIQLTGIMAIYS
jgi:hypothetical protein